MVLILEDSDDRIRRFERALQVVDAGMAFCVWRDAVSMIEEVGPYLPSTRLISLDHDLVARPDGSDAGDGLDVARFLAGQPIFRPVIVHTSNGERGQVMMGELEIAGWLCVRVAPIGPEWIEEDWSGVVRRLIGFPRA